jgi:hypothetical protein
MWGLAEKEKEGSANVINLQFFFKSQNGRYSSLQAVSKLQQVNGRRN